MPPLVQCRHRGKIQIRNPKSHYDRMVMDAITKPVVPLMIEDPAEICSRMKPEFLEENKIILSNTYCNCRYFSYNHGFYDKADG